MHHLPKYHRKPSMHVTVVPNGSMPLQQDNALCHTAKTAQEWPEESYKKLMASTWPLASMGCAGNMAAMAPDIRHHRTCG